MKRLMAIAVGLALTGCGKDPGPPQAPQTSAAAPAPAALESQASLESPPAPAPQRESPRAKRPRIVEPAKPDPVRGDGPPPPPQSPDVVLAINGQGHLPQLVAGWPVVLQLEVSSPDGKPWKVSGGPASWARLVRIEMPGDAAWPFEPALEAPNEVTVDDRTSASLFWTIAPEASAKLPRDERTLRAVLECKGGPEGAWTGVATTRELRMSVVDEPSPLPPGWAESRASIEIDYAFCREGPPAALARAEEAAKAQPESWRLLAMKGRLLTRLDRRGEAIATLEKALSLWSRQNPKAWEPPGELVAQRDALAWDVHSPPEAGTDGTPAPGTPAGPATPERSSPR